MTTKLTADSQLFKGNSLKDQIKLLTTDLLYPSESDEKITYFEMELFPIENFSISDFRMFNGISSYITIQEIDFDKFFAPMIKIEDWYGEDEKKWAIDSLKLKVLLSEKLKDIKILKVGKMEIDVYLFGKEAESKWSGLKTKVIET